MTRRRRRARRALAPSTRMAHPPRHLPAAAPRSAPSSTRTRPFATALACLRRPIPAFHYMVAKAGGDDIRCARYATYGTAALSRNALAALAAAAAPACSPTTACSRSAPTSSSARLLAEEVEALCAQYIHARAAGRPDRPARARDEARAREVRDVRPTSPPRAASGVLAWIDVDRRKPHAAGRPGPGAAGEEERRKAASSSRSATTTANRPASPAASAATSARTRRTAPSASPTRWSR